MDPGIRRAVRIEATFREANEGIKRAAGEHAIVGRIPFICECADAGCTQVVQLTMEEYEQVREQPNWFLIVPGHEDEAPGGTVRVAQRHEEYCVIEKTGEAARLLEELADHRD
jgi:hypothetical protein